MWIATPHQSWAFSTLPYQQHQSWFLMNCYNFIMIFTPPLVLILRNFIAILMNVFYFREFIDIVYQNDCVSKVWIPRKLFFIQITNIARDMDDYNLEWDIFRLLNNLQKKKKILQSESCAKILKIINFKVFASNAVGINETFGKFHWINHTASQWSSWINLLTCEKVCWPRFALMK